MKRLELLPVKTLSCAGPPGQRTCSVGGAATSCAPNVSERTDRYAADVTQTRHRPAGNRSHPSARILKCPTTTAPDDRVAVVGLRNSLTRDEKLCQESVAQVYVTTVGGYRPVERPHQGARVMRRKHPQTLPGIQTFPPTPDLVAQSVATGWGSVPPRTPSQSVADACAAG
jgi:hypothetical protein